MKRTAFSPHGKRYVQYVRSSQKHDMSVQHYHDGYEIYFLLEGRRYLYLDNICYTLERGDVAVLRPFDIHYAKSCEADYYERYVLNFQENFLLEVLNREEVCILLDKLSSCVIHLPNAEAESLCYEFRKAERYMQKGGFLAEKLLGAAALQIIMQVMEYLDESSMVKGKKIPPQIISALEYIQEHYRESITLDEVADFAHMSKYYFCRTFRHITGATVLQYINNVRLSRVHNLLIHTEDSMEEIAVQTGFSSSSNLARVFKKIYGISPREFRKKQRNEMAKSV